MGGTAAIFPPIRRRRSCIGSDPQTESTWARQTDPACCRDQAWSTRTEAQRQFPAVHDHGDSPCRGKTALRVAMIAWSAGWPGSWPDSNGLNTAGGPSVMYSGAVTLVRCAT
jgi:hypothetical protein